jgi:hypothetical protein
MPMQRVPLYSTGMKMKKIKKEFWTPAVQAKFVAVMQAMG